MNSYLYLKGVNTGSGLNGETSEVSFSLLPSPPFFWSFLPPRNRRKLPIDVAGTLLIPLSFSVMITSEINSLHMDKLTFGEVK